MCGVVVRVVEGKDAGPLRCLAIRFIVCKSWSFHVYGLVMGHIFHE